jgi:hypothetical protein
MLAFLSERRQAPVCNGAVPDSCSYPCEAFIDFLVDKWWLDQIFFHAIERSSAVACRSPIESRRFLCSDGRHFDKELVEAVSNQVGKH